MVFNHYKYLLAIITSVIVLFITVIYFYSRYKLNYWKRRGVNQLPTSHWLFGNFKNAILFRTAPGYHLGEIYRQAKPESPFIGFYIFHKPCLLLRDPEIIKQIFINDFKNFSDRHFAGSQQKDSIGMINLFGLKNPAWKYLRTKITPTLTRGKLKQMFPLMMETGEPMMNYIEQQKADKNGVKTLDAQDLSYRYTSNLIANVGLGIKMDSFSNPNADFNKSVMEFFHGFKRMVALVTVFFMPELVQLIGSPMFFNFDFARKIFWDVVKSREKVGTKRGDYIDTVIQLKNGEQNPLYKFEGENLVAQIAIFFSGFETSSTATTFTLMELARHKEYQDRVREEIKRTIEKNGWTYEAFNETKFLEQCIFESVRLHPPVSTIDRKTLKDYTIPNTDVVIEKGTAVYISLFGLHEDSKYFEDPKVFNPERFNPENTVPDAYMPFGTGPRMCVGVKVGKLHVKMVIGAILSQYELYHKLDDMNELDPRSTFTAAVDGINIEFRKLTT